MSVDYNVKYFVLELNLTCDITLLLWDPGGVNLIFVVSHTTNHFQIAETQSMSTPLLLITSYTIFTQWSYSNKEKVHFTNTINY